MWERTQQVASCFFQGICALGHVRMHFSCQQSVEIRAKTQNSTSCNLFFPRNLYHEHFGHVRMHFSCDCDPGLCMCVSVCEEGLQTTANRQSKRAHRENKDFRQVVESERADVARVVAGLVTAAESDVGSLVHVEAGSCREVWCICTKTKLHRQGSGPRQHPA